MWSPSKHKIIHVKQPPDKIKYNRHRQIAYLLACVHLLALGSLQAVGQVARPAERQQRQQQQAPSTIGHSKMERLDSPPSATVGRVSQHQHTSDQQQSQARQEGEDDARARESSIYLESMADLDHAAYLALRNYNLTDERLLQSSWLMGPMALSSHKQHNEESARLSNLLSPSTDLKSRLALMLESLMLHLRSGHLRRMSLEELEQATLGLNLTEALGELRSRRAAIGVLGTNARLSAPKNESADKELSAASSALERADEDGELRCLHLVTLYKSELSERLKEQTPVPQSRVEYESEGNSQPANRSAAESTGLDLEASQKAALVFRENPNQTADNGSGPAAETATGASEQTQAAEQVQVDEMRLMDLCRLAVVCRSSDELIDLISKPWAAISGPQGESRLPRETRRRALSPSSPSDPEWHLEHLERESSEDAADQRHQADEGRSSSRARKSLRDSLSMSLAKLCPLILLPLHEDEGKCMVRRDDRPPMVTVWAFATLFVTIVCFCSLIGLSITPLLGQSPADTSTGGSEASGPVGTFERAESARVRHSRAAAAQNNSNSGGNKQLRRQHKASLTLFEGLAVGSLVGSALFSLIPQAFELQERESNHGFLLKAFIIFSGIYLFFLSERIMRIILDTRQKRKKKKRLNHRSSTTVAAEVPGGCNDTPRQLFQQLVGAPMRRRHQSQSGGGLQQILSPVPLLGATSATSSSRQRPSTASSRGSDAAARASANVQSGSSSMKKESPTMLLQMGSSGDRLKSPPTAKAAAAQQSHQIVMLGRKVARAKRQEPGGSFEAVVQPPIIESQLRGEEEKFAVRGNRPNVILEHENSLTGAQKRQRRKRVLTNSRQLHHRPAHQQRKPPTAQRVDDSRQQLTSLPTPIKQRRNQSSRRHQRQHQRPRINFDSTRNNKSKTTRKRLTKQAQARRQLTVESDLDDYYHHADSSHSSSTSSTSSSSSFSSYALKGRRSKAQAQDGLVMLHTEDSRADYSGSSSSSIVLSKCSSCASFDPDFCSGAVPNNPSDSDDDNIDQRRAVSKQMSEISRRYAQQKQQMRTTFKFDDQLVEVNSAVKAHQQLFTEIPTGSNYDTVGLGRHMDMRHMGPIYVNQINQHAAGNNDQKQDISTVAWMIILGDGLHNFIDGISIGAAFSESILSGVSISVAVICEEFPHELGDFAVLVSSGMTVRQALGYNFLSACTCYLGMAVGIILGDVTDGASYISALAAGVFLYIALVDMMGELSAALESSSRESIARTLKLLLLQNVGIAIGISIIFVLSFIDF